MRSFTVSFSLLMVLLTFAMPSHAQAPPNSKITIAIIGDDRVAESKPWMRSTMIASFEDAMVATKRFRVVSQSLITQAIEAGRLAGSGPMDPAQAIQIGKIVQAKYVVIVRQLRAQAQKRGMGGFGAATFDLALQAQVINIQTTDLHESLTYERKVAMESGVNGFFSGKDEPLPEDKLGPKYSAAIKDVATEFITTAAVQVMPLETLVAAVSPTQVIIEAGSDIGVGVGSEFEVWRDDGEIVLSSGKKIVQSAKAGRIRVTRVDTEISYAQMVETYGDTSAKDPVVNPTRVQKGMVARFAPVVAPTPAKKK
jgi:hypothetical protein